MAVATTPGRDGDSTHGGLSAARAMLGGGARHAGEAPHAPNRNRYPVNRRRRRHSRPTIHDRPRLPWWAMATVLLVLAGIIAARVLN